MKNAGRLIRSVEAFHQSLVRQRMVRLEERDRCGADRHKHSLNLGYTNKDVTDSSR